MTLREGDLSQPEYINELLPQYIDQHKSLFISWYCLVYLEMLHCLQCSLYLSILLSVTRQKIRRNQKRLIGMGYHHLWIPAVFSLWLVIINESYLYSHTHIYICYERKGNTYEPEYRYELLPQYLDQHKRSNRTRTWDLCTRKNYDGLMIRDSVLHYIWSISRLGQTAYCLMAVRGQRDL